MESVSSGESALSGLEYELMLANQRVYNGYSNIYSQANNLGAESEDVITSGIHNPKEVRFLQQFNKTKELLPSFEDPSGFLAKVLVKLRDYMEKNQ